MEIFRNFGENRENRRFFRNFCKIINNLEIKIENKKEAAVAAFEKDGNPKTIR